MAYPKRNFKKDQLLTADDLNKMDDQIALNEESAKNANESLKNKLDKTSIVQTTGSDEDKVMSQAAATKEFGKLSEDIDEVKETIVNNKKYVIVEHGGYGFINPYLNIIGADALTYYYSKPILLKRGCRYSLSVKAWSGVSVLTECKEDGTLTRSLVEGEKSDEITVYNYAPSYDMYVVACGETSAPITLLSEIIDSGFEIPMAFGGYGYIEPDLVITGEGGTTYFYSKPILLRRGYRYYISTKAYSNVSVLTECKEDGALVKSLIEGIATDEIQTYSYVPTFDMFVIVCGETRVQTTMLKEDVTQGFEIKTQFGGFGYYNCYLSLLGSTAESYYYTLPIKLLKGCKYEFNLRAWFNVCVVCETDENGSPTKPLIMGERYQGNKSYFHIPNEDKWVVLCSATGYPLTVKAHLMPQEPQTWVAIGDSLTEKNYRAYNNYTDFVSNDLNLYCVNLGHSGWKYDEFLSVLESQMPNDFDIISIFGSGNGITSKPMGTVDDNRLSDDNIDTLFGDINNTINYYKNNYPTKPLVIITPTPWEELCDGRLDGSLMDTYSNGLVEICKLSGIPCLDLYHCSGLFPWNQDVKTEYYLEQEIQDPGCHPNTKAHKKYIAPKVREIFKSVLHLDENY